MRRRTATLLLAALMAVFWPLVWHVVELSTWQTPSPWVVAAIVIPLGVLVTGLVALAVAAIKADRNGKGGRRRRR